MGSVRLSLFLAVSGLVFLFLTVAFVVTFQYPLFAMMSFFAAFAAGLGALITLRRACTPRPGPASTPIWTAAAHSYMAADVCPICLEVLARDVVSLPCTHAFHEECIAQWFQHKTSCPICMFHYEP